MSSQGDQFQFFAELATKVISVTEASEIVVNGESLSARHINRLIQEGKMAGIRLGRNYFTSREAVRDYLYTDRRTGPKSDKR